MSEYGRKLGICAEKNLETGLGKLVQRRIKRPDFQVMDFRRATPEEDKEEFWDFVLQTRFTNNERTVEHEIPLQLSVANRRSNHYPLKVAHAYVGKFALLSLFWPLDDYTQEEAGQFFYRIAFGDEGALIELNNFLQISCQEYLFRNIVPFYMSRIGQLGWWIKGWFLDGLGNLGWTTKDSVLLPSRYDRFVTLPRKESRADFGITLPGKDGSVMYKDLWIKFDCDHIADEGDEAVVCAPFAVYPTVYDAFVLMHRASIGEGAFGMEEFKRFFQACLDGKLSEYKPGERWDSLHYKLDSHRPLRGELLRQHRAF